MKNIFLSIDFSDHAYNAALYAAELAKHTGTRLILFHSYSPTLQTDAEELGDELQDLERKAQVKLDALACKLRSLYPISITRLLKPGNVVEETLYVANKIKSDLLLVGVAETNYQHFPVLDALTAALLAKATLPVLLIPPKAIFRSFEQAFVNLDENEATHSISDLKFLNKFFYRFRDVQFMTPEHSNLIPADHILEKPLTNSYTKAAQAQEELANEANVTKMAVLDQQAHVLVKSYTSPAGLLIAINSSSVPLSDVVPILLLPNSNPIS